MTQSNQSKPILDNSFSAFIAGLTIGIAGVMLLGTKEGRKLTQKALKSIPEDLTKTFSDLSTPPPPPPQVAPSPDTHMPPNSSTPPPPPKPLSKPSPTFFSS